MKLHSMARDLGALLKQRSETVAISESSTGGLVSAALLSVAGASTYFLGGGVIYTGAARQALLDLPADLPAEMRSASEAYASLCARTVREKLDATWGLAETGATGPTGNRYGDRPGHCCLAVAGPVALVTTLETDSDDREGNMWAFAQAALNLLARAIDSGEPGQHIPR
jgi:nicotinamide-nucleotide amidase